MTDSLEIHDRPPSDADTLAALVEEQRKEIERLREQVGKAWGLLNAAIVHDGKIGEEWMNRVSYWLDSVAEEGEIRDNRP